MLYVRAWAPMCEGASFITVTAVQSHDRDGVSDHRQLDYHCLIIPVIFAVTLMLIKGMVFAELTLYKADFNH